jgi:hypothetical protein
MDLMDRPRGHDWNESRNGSGPNSPDIYDSNHHRAGIPPPGAHVFNPAILSLRPPHPGSGSPPNPPQTVSGNTNPNVNKPRIWSLADMASKENKDDTTNSPMNGNSYAASMHGKILSPLAARGLHTLHHPYMRHPEIYRNFYNPGGPHDAAILESYQRTFNATLAHNGIPPGAVPLSSMLKGSPFGPLSLTSAAGAIPSVNNNHSAPQPTAPLPRASSPASSTSSTPEHSTPERSTAVTTTPITPVAINVTKP